VLHLGVKGVDDDDDDDDDDDRCVLCRHILVSKIKNDKIVSSCAMKAQNGSQVALQFLT
jgi:hypothetical protein